MKILLLSLNYAPERVGIAVYSTGMAEALAAMGHDVRVVSGKPYYPAWKIAEGFSSWKFTRETLNGVDLHRVPLYVPSQPTGARRMLHHLSFAISASLTMLSSALAFRPDVVLAVAPSLVAAPLAAMAGALCGAPTWLHIQDFEVDAAFATGLLDASSRIGKLARAFERFSLKHFDIVSTISPQMCRTLQAKGIPADRVVEFRNWAEMDVAPGSDSAYRAEWAITTPYVALYSGNIANKQGIDIIVDAARLLQQRSDVTFVICGEGPNRANLEQRAAGLANIQFRDLQPRARLGELLNLATVHLLPQLQEAADLVLPSKLTNMLASGKPKVATALPGTGLYDEVTGCGLLTNPEDATGFAAAIAQLLDHDALRQELGRVAIARARERWSKPAILGRLDNALGRLVSLRTPHPRTPSPEGSP